MTDYRTWGDKDLIEELSAHGEDLSEWEAEFVQQQLDRWDSADDPHFLSVLQREKADEIAEARLR